MDHRSIYVRVFPPTTIRRFVVDQTISWSIFLGYYLGIILGTIFSIFSILYFLGSTTISYFQMKEDVPVIIIGALSTITLFLIIVLLCIILSIIECFDYVPWLQEQKEYLEQLENGKYDAERAEYVPITLTTYQKISYKIFPIMSYSRYIVRVLVYAIIFVLLIRVHVYISIKTFPFDIKDIWVLKWLISSLIQMFMALIICGIYMCVEPSCKKDWKRFKSQVASAESKK